MCGFDSCYPCFMLLNIFETRFRKNKIRRRGFVYKKPCPIRKQRRKFRMLKRKIIFRNIKRSYKIRWAHRKMWKFRYLHRGSKRKLLKTIATRKIFRSTRSHATLPSRDVLFSYWVNKPTLRSMKYNNIWLFVKKMIFLNYNSSFVLKNYSTSYCDPFVVFWRSSHSKFKQIMDIYRPFYYNSLSYSTLNNLGTYESFFDLSKRSLIDPKKKLFFNHQPLNLFSKNPLLVLIKKLKSLSLVSQTTYTKARSTTPEKESNVLIQKLDNISKNEFTDVLEPGDKVIRQFYTEKRTLGVKARYRTKKPSASGYTKSMKGYHKVRKENRQKFLKRYTTKVKLQAAMNKNLIRAGKVQVSSYFLKLNDYLNNYVLRITEKGALYKTQGFRQKFKQQHSRVKGLNQVWLASTMDNYFETMVDYNCKRGKQLSKKPPIRFKHNQLNSYRQLLFSQQATRFKLPKNTLVSRKESKLPVPNSSVSMFQNLNQNSKLLHNVSLTGTILSNKIIYKYLSFNHRDLKTWSVARTNHLALKSFSNDLAHTHFNSRVTAYSCSNILPSQFFKYSIRRKLFKLFKFHKFSVNVTMWYYNMLIRFMENCSGKKVYLKFNPFIENSLTFSDIARCNMWAIRVLSFQRILGPKIFVQESLQIFHVAIRSKDPTFLSNWIKGMLQRMSFWKYRLLFRYFKFVMRYLFWTHFADLGFKGLKLRLKGKISVAGNARTRTLRYAIGETSYSTFNNKVVSDFSTINTFTGVLGFRIWFFF